MMKDHSLPVLLVDDEEEILMSYGLILRTAGIDHVATARDSRKVMSLLEQVEAAVVVIDLIMPHVSGVTLLSRITADFPQIPVIVMTASNELEKAIECMKLGAYDYLVKPVEKSRFVSSVRRALEMRMLREEVISLRDHFLLGGLENGDAFSHIVTRSRKMITIFQYLEAIAPNDRPVCFCGETGSGKELLARALYKASGRGGKYIAVNVAGLDDTVFSDTLFGHRKGAYTGADNNRDGLIAQAGGGMLLLDEIGDLSEASQIKLLRLLEEKTYYPLGSDVPDECDARIIAATNKDIKERVSRGLFRKDLYYRLCTHAVYVPPLRDRPEDIPVLFEHFLQDAAQSLNKKKPSYGKELLTLFSAHPFPGNVRELESMVYDAMMRHRSGVLSLKPFGDFIRTNRAASPPEWIGESEDEDIGLRMDQEFPTLKETEQMLIARALKQAKGNQGVAATLLGISRQALNKRLQREKKRKD